MAATAQGMHSQGQQQAGEASVTLVLRAVRSRQRANRDLFPNMAAMRDAVTQILIIVTVTTSL